MVGAKEKLAQMYAILVTKMSCNFTCVSIPYSKLHVGHLFMLNQGQL